MPFAILPKDRLPSLDVYPTAVGASYPPIALHDYKQLLTGRLMIAHQASWANIHHPNMGVYDFIGYSGKSNVLAIISFDDSRCLTIKTVYLHTSNLTRKRDIAGSIKT